MRFGGKVAIVTGAGGGLGAHYSAALAREGAAVVAADLRGPGVERDRGGDPRRRGIVPRGDRGPDGRRSRWPHGRRRRWTGTAASTSSSTTPAAAPACRRRPARSRRRTPTSWDLHFGANLKTAFLCTRAVAAPMKRQRYGKIVNISSRSARITDPTVHQSPAYAAAKTAVLGLTRFSARELGPYGITVNCLVPSLAISGPVLQSYWDRMSPERQAQFLEQIALRRLPRPEELTSAVLFLCSDESSYITGATPRL